MLKEQFKWDDENASETVKFLENLYPGSTTIFDDLDSQFEKLKSLIPPRPYSKSEQLKAWLLMDSQRQLALMATTLLRGHITDAHGNARRAVELTATIGRILRDETERTSLNMNVGTGQPPAIESLSNRAGKKARKAAARARNNAAKKAAKPDLVTLWFASDSDTGLEKYRNEAKIANLWNNSLSTVPELRTKYSMLCKSVHTGAYSIVNSLPRNSDGKLVFDEYKPHQLSSDGTELMIHFLFLSDCFIQVLEGLADSYGVMSDVSWNVSINSWRAKRDLIRDTFEPKLKEAGAY